MITLLLANRIRTEEPGTILYGAALEILIEAFLIRLAVVFFLHL